MRNLIADWARRRAWVNLHRCGDARTAVAKTHFLHRSYFWGDVEAWVDGLGAWRELRRAHRHVREA